MDNAEKNNKKPAQEENKPEIKTKPQIPDNEDEEEEDTRPSYMKKRVIVPTITAIIFFLTGIYFIIHSFYYQETDDAFIEGHIVSVAPRVAGPVVKLLVDDNQPVKKGDLILEIDPKDYETALAQKEAKLAEARANLNIAEKKITESQADLNQSTEDISASESKLDFAKKDYKRYTDMHKAGIASKQDYDQSKTALTVAQSGHNAALERERAAHSMLQSAKSKKDATIAEIKRLEAEVEQAKLDLSYTKIYAPQDGLITNRSVEQGNYVQVAQPMLAVVPEKMWIVANFKETQLANMHPGQPVEIKVDTYRGKKFKGKVDSIQRATGAKASLFPPENAVGSYVKIVQRVPVKIIFTEDISKYNIVPGMSVVPEVKVR